MLITSRAAQEYRAMFDLTDADLSGSVLDCCAGGSSFVAESAGKRVMAVDPAYRLGPVALAGRVLAALGDGERMIEAHRDRFDWSWYGDAVRRKGMRAGAARAFLADIRAWPGRYVAGALPDLPFADGSFELVLCSHLLFTWADTLGVGWHRRALAELVRVARREVRIFPLVVAGSGDSVPFLTTLRGELHAGGHRTRLREVDYRFQRGARHMLVITPR
ncbi:methyltransferase domain-containing protein [Actinophytocola sp.]|uniref:methyltransferase domain-containing protein n=1 Tax=Actinophytocola sp. TaxID=1872138 RepID=UPI002D809C3C|nr:methyltransferase domain-containing protein [Actinophytocola sp.]HET9141408.1 methyltransferase domain-containing protein [Actinophytocola sp.]